MRIGELARLVGVSTDTVRFYERSGWLPKAGRRANAYREYDASDVEHLRLLVDLRRLELPLEDAARVAGWCHAGHCAETTEALPRLIAEQRRLVAERVAGLRALDARLSALERHLDERPRQRRALTMLGTGVGPGSAAACCDAAGAVVGGGCACCASG